MHRLLMASTMLAGLVAMPALADNTAIGGHEPLSTAASNIDQSTAPSAIAPQLPAPPTADDAHPRDLLNVASQALAKNQTGLAQESLERAETRLLTRTTAPDHADSPDNATPVRLITSARMAIAHHDLQGANSDIQQALAALPQATAATP
jgi:hypothetical protein